MLISPQAEKVIMQIAKKLFNYLVPLIFGIFLFFSGSVQPAGLLRGLFQSFVGPSVAQAALGGALGGVDIQQALQSLGGAGGSSGVRAKVEAEIQRRQARSEQPLSEEEVQRIFEGFHFEFELEQRVKAAVEKYGTVQEARAYLLARGRTMESLDALSPEQVKSQMWAEWMKSGDFGSISRSAPQLIASLLSGLLEVRHGEEAAQASTQIASDWQSFKDRFMDEWKNSGEFLRTQFWPRIREQSAEVSKIAHGAKDFFMEMGLQGVGILTLLMAAWPLTQYGIKLAIEQFALWLAKKPFLVEETNVRSSFINSLRAAQRIAGIKEKKFPLIRDVKLDQDTCRRGLALAKSICNIRDNNGFFRNAIFWGAPGTGKTMFAQAMANQVDCYFVQITGSSISRLDKAQALIELDRLFKWINGANKPVLLIIDEAENLLISRDKSMSEEKRDVLMYLMAKMGTESNKLMVVALTNRPEDIDEAMQSRFPIHLEFKLPTFEQRAEIIKLNLKRMIFDRNIELADPDLFNDQRIEWLAGKTEGMAGREIMLLLAGIAEAPASSNDNILTAQLLELIVQDALEDFKAQKTGFKRTQSKVDVSEQIVQKDSVQTAAAA